MHRQLCKARHVALILVAACASSASAQHEHEPIEIAANGAGALRFHTHAPSPFGIEPSLLPSFPGYTTTDLPFESLIDAVPSEDLFLLPDTADIRLVFLGATPGLDMYLGPTPMLAGQEFTLGVPTFHIIPIYHVPSGGDGQFFFASFRVRDASGQLADIAPFSMAFTTVPAPAAMILPCGVGMLAMRRRRA